MRPAAAANWARDQPSKLRAARIWQRQTRHLGIDGLTHHRHGGEVTPGLVHPLFERSHRLGGGQLLPQRQHADTCRVALGQGQLGAGLCSFPDWSRDELTSEFGLDDR